MLSRQRRIPRGSHAQRNRNSVRYPWITSSPKTANVQPRLLHRDVLIFVDQRRFNDVSNAPIVPAIMSCSRSARSGPVAWPPSMHQLPIFLQVMLRRTTRPARPASVAIPFARTGWSYPRAGACAHSGNCPHPEPGKATRRSIHASAENREKPAPTARVAGTTSVSTSIQETALRPTKIALADSNGFHQYAFPLKSIVETRRLKFRLRALSMCETRRGHRPPKPSPMNDGARKSMA